MGFKKKILTILIILLIIPNLFSILNIYPLTLPFSEKYSENNNKTLIQNMDYNYNFWYNYTINSINRSGIFHGDWTDQQKDIIENLSLTYLWRTQGVFNDLKYNNFNYWKIWCWNNIITLFFPNMTYESFLTHASHADKVLLEDITKLYWGLMVNNYTIEEADDLLTELGVHSPKAYLEEGEDVNLTISTDYKISCHVHTRPTPFRVILLTQISLEWWDPVNSLWVDITSKTIASYQILPKEHFIEATNHGYTGKCRLSVDFIHYTFLGIPLTIYDVFHPENNQEEFNVRDDDDSPPRNYRMGGSGGITIADNDSMFLYFYFIEEREKIGDFGVDKGMNITYRYAFFEGCPEVFPETDGVVYNTIVTSADVYEGSHEIPKSEWELNAGKTLYFQAKASNNDTDRTGDQETSDWTSPYMVGKVYENAEGQLEKINQSSIIRVGSEWKWQDYEIFSIEDTRVGDPIKEIYVGQPLTMNLFISNPSETDSISVRNGFLRFFAAELHNPLSIAIWEPPLPYTTLGPGSNPILLDYTFDYDEFTWNSNGIELTIVGSFEYTYDLATPFQTKTFTRTFVLIRPPEPQFQFIGFEGPKDDPTDDHFVYKTEELGPSTIMAVFQVINNARVPIRISQVVDFESAWYAQDQDSTTGQNMTALLDIEGDQINPITTTIYPTLSGSNPTEIYVDLRVISPIFFFDLFGNAADIAEFGETVVGSIAMMAGIIKEVIPWLKTHLPMLMNWWKWGKPFKGVGLTCVELILALFDTVIMEFQTEHSLTSVDWARFYKFKSVISWEYQFDQVESFEEHTTYGYTNQEHIIPGGTSEYLILKPSSYQWGNYIAGLVLGWVGISASWASFFLGLSKIWFLKIAAIISSLLSLLFSVLSSEAWNRANDPPFMDANYTEVVEPTYRNITLPQPQNSLDASIYELTDSAIKLEGDLQALNTSIARKNTATVVRDNESLIKQNDAIYNYSSMVANDYEELEIGVIIYSNEFNKSITEDNVTQAETRINEEGIPESDRGNLTQYGYNETEIAEIENYVKNQTVTHSISLLRSSFRNVKTYLIGNISHYSTSLQQQSEIYEELAKQTLIETIILKNTTQNIPITTADPAILDQLEVLFIQADNKLEEKAWTAAIDLAKDLKNLALDTIEKTLNQTYFFYIEEAKRIIKNAEEKMKIDVIPTNKEIPIKAGVPETMDLIILSTGAPSGTYQLVSNSSWVQPMIQDVDVVEWKSTTVPLTIHLIESFDVAPGQYPINLTIYLEGTDTKKTIIIFAIVVSTKVENNMNFIFCEIADLREEVDARVCFLFDWLIINQLDNAEEFLNGALETYHANATAKSVVLDKLAKANIELSDIITIILDWIGFISEEDGDFISNYLHTIRDHITLTMGATVGTEEAMKVAQIEMEIERMADQIFAEYDLRVALSIDIKLWVASKSLDYALIWMALECGDIAENHIILCIQELQCAKCVINDLKAEGKLPGDEADALILTLNGFIAELELLYTHPFHEGDGGTGDIPTHQETEESNNEGIPDSSGTGGQTESPNTEMPTH